MSGLGGNGGHHEHHGPAAATAGGGVGSAAAAAAASTGFPGHVTAALGIHPHHFALIETAFNNAAGLRQLAGLQHHQQHAQQQQQQQHQPQQLQHHQQVHPHHIQTLQQQHHLQQQQMHQQGSPGLLSPPLQQQAEQLHPPQNQQELRHLYNQVANHHQNQHQQNVQQSIQQNMQPQQHPQHGINSQILSPPPNSTTPSGNGAVAQQGDSGRASNTLKSPPQHLSKFNHQSVDPNFKGQYDSNISSNGFKPNIDESPPNKYNVSNTTSPSNGVSTKPVPRNASTELPRRCSSTLSIDSSHDHHPAVMPLDVQLTEGTQPIPSPLDKCPQEKGLDPTVQQKQQIILNHSTRLHDEHEDVKPKDLEIKTELVDSLLMHKIENEADDDENDFEEDDDGSEGVEVTKLRNLVEEIGDASLIWKVVRSRILSQCQVWDLLMDKACFRYYGEQSNNDKKPSPSSGPILEKTINSQKFKAVLTEMEILLGEFKCLMDGCLEAIDSDIAGQKSPIVASDVENSTFPQPIISDKELFVKSELPDQKSSQESTSQSTLPSTNPVPSGNSQQNDVPSQTSDASVVAVTASLENGKPDTSDAKPFQKCFPGDMIQITPELSRAYNQPIESRWQIKQKSDINTLYQHFFTENETERREASDMMFNQWMLKGGGGGGGGEESALEDEDDDAEMSYEVKVPPGSLRPPIKKGSAANSEFIHECSTCPRRYKHLNNLRRHEAVCKGQPMVDDTQWKKTLDGRYHCTYPGCAVAADQPDKNWATLQGVQQHYNQVHARPEDLQYPCDLCQIKFSSKNLLNYHRKVKHSLSSAGNRMFPCNQCGKEFSSQAVLERHTAIHLGNGEQLETQKVEDSVVPTNGDATVHKFDDVKTELPHLKEAKAKSEPVSNRLAGKRFAYSCNRCTRRYKSTKNLLRHQKTCTGVPPPNVKPTWRKDASDGRYYCTFQGCNTNKTWTCSSGVWKHYNAEHADVEDPGYCVYPCDLCEERFPTKTMYNQHRKHKHLALFQYTCTVCGKRLPSTLRLKLHMRLHTGEKPYKCDLCDYRSATQSAVNQHKMRMHEEHSQIALQRHVCEICGKSFKVKSNLKEHIRSHSDARTFLCGFCGKALKNRQCLNRHLFTHGVKYTCQNCGKNFANPSSLHVHRRDKHGVVQ